MTDEQKVIAACLLDRQAYEQLQRHAGRQEFSQLGQFWLDQVEEYYERDEQADKVDRKLLREMGKSAADARHAETLTSYYDELPLVGISPSNVIAHILELQRANTGLRLASLLTAPEQSDYEKIREHVERYQDLLHACESGLKKLKILDYDSLDAAYDEELIVRLWPKPLQSRCLGGGAMPGHHILVFGRPEAGKSLFAINLAAGVAYDGKKVLYFGNEESVKSHGIRLACRLAGSNISEFQQNAEAIKARARKRGLDRVTFVEITPGTFAEIEEGITEFAPDMVVIDQLAGVDVGESNPVRAIDKAARGFRTLILRHSIVGVSVSQAGDRTERAGQLPPTWLSMSDVYGSRTGLPAQVDLMLGLGYDQDMWNMDLRAVSLPKNKLGGNHDGFKVRIDKQQAKVKGLGTAQDA